MKTEQGALSITRTNSSAGPDYITVELELRGERLKAQLSLEQFAMLVTGRQINAVSIQIRLLPGAIKIGGPGEEGAAEVLSGEE